MARLVLLAALVALATCGSRGAQQDSQRAGPPPEERFGNDLALVSRFAELKACSFRDGRLDITCPQLKTLRQQLERAGDEPERRARLHTTLLNLLDSTRELTRLVAAESLQPLRHDPKVKAALRSALPRERSATVKAALLRQLCWEPGEELPPGTLELLRAGTPERVRLEAAACLGHLRKLTPAVTTRVRQALQTDPAPAVRGALCEALGQLRAAAAIPEMAAQLVDEQVGWRCAMALASVGGQTAYEALVRGLGEALKRDRVATPLVSAVASFSTESFFERSTVVDLLEQAVEDRRLSGGARGRAVLELQRLDPYKLYKLRQSYREASSESDRQVKEALDQAQLGR